MNFPTATLPTKMKTSKVPPFSWLGARASRPHLCLDSQLGARASRPHLCLRYRELGARASRPHPRIGYRRAGGAPALPARKVYEPPVVARRFRWLLAALLFLAAMPAAAQDFDPPSIAVLESGAALTDGSLFNRAVVPVIQVVDASTFTVAATLDGQPYTSGTAVHDEGRHELLVTATDAGNQVATVEIGFEIDRISPVFATLSPAAGTVTAAAAVTLTGQLDGPASLTIDGAAIAVNSGGQFVAGPYSLTEGHRDFALVATDAAGNGTARGHRLTRDAVAPALSIATPAAGAVVGSSPPDIEGTVSDAHAVTVTVSGVAATLAGNTWKARVPLAEGGNDIVVRAVDAAGNAATASRRISLDSLPPQVAITDPATATVVPGATLAVSGSASDANLERVEVNGVAASLQNGAFSATVPLAEGDNQLEAKAFDSLGQTATASVTVRRDGQAPAIAISSPADGAYLNASEVEVGGTIGAGAGLTVTVGGEPATVTGDSFSLAGVALAEGENRLIARVTDGAGNQGTHAILVYRDTVAPQLLSTAPAGGALGISGDTAFTVTFSEKVSGAPPAAFKLETGAGASIAASGTYSGSSLTVEPAAALPSQATVRLTVGAGIADRAGNPLAAPQTFEFTTRDGQPPALPSLAPAPPAALCAVRLELAGTTEALASLQVTGGAAAAGTQAGADGAFLLSVPLVPGQHHQLSITARDAEGNVSPPRLVEVVHDCRPPVLLGATLESGAFEIVFDEKLAPASLTPAAVKVFAGEGQIAGTLNLAAGGEVVIFTPAALPAGALRLDVATGVRDLAGNSLAFPFSQVFGAGEGDSFVAGRVIDASTGRPLAGALVLVLASGGQTNSAPEPQQTTGEDGRFSIALPAGSHFLLVRRLGYTPAFRYEQALPGLGADLIDPRLTPAAPFQTIGAAGGNFEGEGPRLAVPAEALAADAQVAVTALEEQALPALLPYGWSPRGAVWLDLGGAELAIPATLSFAVNLEDGETVPVARLDNVTLQWHVVELAPVVDGRVTALAAGEGAYAALEGDPAPLAPPPATAGAVLGSAEAPNGENLLDAALAFDPELVLPSQRSEVTATYQVAAPVASGLPLTLRIREELTLLGGTVRHQPTYESDLILYHDAAGAPSSRFGLKPSLEAREVPIEVGAEEVQLRRYLGATVRGNVLGPAGGVVETPEGDKVELAPGSLAAPTPVVLTRREEAELPLELPAGLVFEGLLDLDLAGQTLGKPANLQLELGAAPAAGAAGSGLLLGFESRGSAQFLRPLAQLEATAGGWRTAAIDSEDLAWPGITHGGLYLFARSSDPLAFVRGQVFGLDGQPLPGAWVSAPQLGWIQVAGEEGSYVLPIKLTTPSLLAENLTALDAGGAALATAPSVGQRVDLDLRIMASGPRVLAIVPAAGSQAITLGIEPTITFSEAVAPASLPAGIQLYQDGRWVPASLETQGALVRLVPDATLRPGRAYEIRVNSEVRDLQGQRLLSPVISGFTTASLPVYEDLDFTRIHLFEPDAAGQARVLGRTGAVPAGALVFVENISRLISTPSATADSQGGFELSVEARLTDVLLLHVVPTGKNETVVELTPFLTADGHAAYVSREAVAFTTLEGIEVKIEAGTFDRPTLVRLAVVPTTAIKARRPSDFNLLFAFDLDTGGATARKAITLRLPVQTSEPFPLLLGREVDFLGETYWTLDALLRPDGDRLTTEPDPAELAGLLSQPPWGPRPVGRLASTSRTAMLEIAVGAAVLGPPGGPHPKTEYVPGAANNGRYLLMQAMEYLDYALMPLNFMPGLTGAVLNAAVDGMMLIFDLTVEALLVHDAILVPTRRGQPFHLIGLDASGLKFFEQTFAAPPPGVLLELPPDGFGDVTPPLPISGSPLRFDLLVVPASSGSRDIGPRISQTAIVGESGEASLLILGQARAVDKNVEVQAIGLDDEVRAVVTAAADGSFSLNFQVTRGHRYLLASGARILAQQELRIGFSEDLAADWPGIEVFDGSRKLEVRMDPMGTRSELRILPPTVWQAGHQYSLRFGTGLVDAAGNSWNRNLTVKFEVAGSQEGQTYPLDEVRDLARLGSLIFVAAGEDGLAVLDGSDPLHLKSLVGTAENPIYFPFPFGDPVTAVAVDPHGRVFVAGGGVDGFGQLKILDPTAINPAAIAANPNNPAVRYAAFRGSTLISDKLGGGGTTLPEGKPRRLAIHSNDDIARFKVGDEPQPGFEVSYSDELAEGVDVEATFVGTDGEPDHPVTVRNLSLGRFAREDADEDGGYEIKLKVRQGDRVEIVKNRRTLAYVAVTGVGVQVVGIDSFYREEHGSPGSWVASDILGTYTGFGDPDLRLCNQPVSDISVAIQDLGLLREDEALKPHPLSLVTLIGFRGLALFDSPLEDPASLAFFNEVCLDLEGSSQLGGLEVVEHYPFDLDGDGIFAEEEYRDYILVAHRNRGIFLFDAENRDDLRLVERMPMPGTLAELTLDRERRTLYVAGSAGGLHRLDFDRPPLAEPDADDDGKSDRLIETLALPGNTNSPTLVVPQLGIAYAGGLERGLTSLAVGGPQIAAMGDTLISEDEILIGDDPSPAYLPRWRALNAVWPLALPAPSVDEVDEVHPGFFHLMAALPGFVGSEIRLDLESLGPTGAPMPGVGNSEQHPGLPRTALTGPEHGVVLERLADNRWEDGYQLFLSKRVEAIADLRAAADYQRTPAEDQICIRCPGEREESGGLRQILSGNRLAIKLPEALRNQLGALYPPHLLDGSELSLASIPWDISPAVDQEPLASPSNGGGAAVPGTLLHSGELTQDATDLFLRGAQVDLAFKRTYRNQTLGSGPLGPGWDFDYRQRLRELPTGDVEFFDGRGRRELFELLEGGTESEGPRYGSPPGRLVKLTRTGAGWVMIDPRHNLIRFDRFGRLAAMSDWIKDSQADESGTQLEFEYDTRSRLVRIEAHGREILLDYDDEDRLEHVRDFLGRKLDYEYDAAGRLAKVISPQVTTGLEGGPRRLETSYEYSPATGALTELLHRRDNLTGITNPKNQTTLAFTYADANHDGFAEEVTSESWGGNPVGIAYDFGQQRAVVTDRRGKAWTFVHDEWGHATRITGPTGAVLERSYSEAGVLKSEKLPGGRLIVNNAAPGGDDPRQLGNITETKVTPGEGGPNGSSVELVTTFSDFGGRTNFAATVRDPRGNVTRNVLSEVGLPLSTVQPEGAITHTEYNKAGQPTKVTDPNGNVVTYTYYSEHPKRGFVESMTVDPGGLGLVTRYEVDQYGNTSAEIDPRGVRREYVYNELGWLVEQRGPLDAKAKFAYDENGRVVEEKHSAGESGEAETAIRYEYGDLGETRKIRGEVSPGGPELVETFAYDKNLNLIEAVARDGQISRLEYDDRNLPVKRITGGETALARSETYVYDADGEVVEYKDALDRSWKTVFDGYGRVKEEIDPLGGKVATTYDDNGNPRAVRTFDSEGTLVAITRSEWDGLDRLVEVTEYAWETAENAPLATGIEPPADSRALTSRVRYDLASNVLEIADPRGVATLYQYDKAGRLKMEKGADGSEQTLHYDASGNTWKTDLVERGPGGAATSSRVLTVFDQLNRATERTDAAGNITRYAYDVRGNLLRFTDAENNVTSHTWDGLGRLLGTQQPAGIVTFREYDAGSRLTKLTDALGQATRWSYDALGRLAKITYADGTERRILEYDRNDRPLKTKDAMDTEVVDTYDALGRLTQRAITPGPGVEGPQSENFQYDALGNVKFASSGGIVTTRRFDSLSRMVAETNDGRASAHRFDDAGNPALLQYPSGRQVTYTPDSANRLSVVDWQLGNNQKVQKTVYSYRGPQVEEKVLGLAVQGKTEFDAGRRPVSTSFANAASERFFAERVKWSARNLRQAITRGDQNNRGYEATYDAAGRLTMAESKVRTPAGEYQKASIPGLPAAFAYTFDGAQNLLSMRQDEVCEADVDLLPLDGSGRNRPGSVDGVALEWDANGNLARKGDRTYKYDYRNRLTRVLGAGDQEIASYAYDSIGRRVRKAAGGSEERTVWAGWQPIEIYRGGVLKTRRTYGSGLDEVLAVEQDLDGTGGLEREYLPIYDATGSVAMLADTDGNPIEKYAYSPFGDRWIEVDDTPPAWHQLRLVDGRIWLEASEEGDLERLVAAAQDGSLRLANLSRGGNATLKVAQPVLEGRQARHRVVLSDAEEGSVASLWPAAGENASLTIAAAALQDLFGNSAQAGISRSFSWPAPPPQGEEASDPAPLEDSAAPRVVRVCTTADRRLELELSEPPDQNQLSTVIAVDGFPVAWELDPDGYLLRSTPLEAGSYLLSLSTEPLDLAGSGLASTFSLTVDVAAVSPAKTHFAEPLPGLVASSTVANPLGWHGFALDEESGFYHLRHRYYDPELGRFTTTDPLGFVDGPNPYQFALNSPFTFDDPMGQMAEAPFAFFAAEAALGGQASYQVGDSELDRMDPGSDRTLGQSHLVSGVQSFALGMADNVGLTGVYRGAENFLEQLGWQELTGGAVVVSAAVIFKKGFRGGGFRGGGRRGVPPRVKSTPPPRRPPAAGRTKGGDSQPSRVKKTKAKSQKKNPCNGAKNCLVAGTLVLTENGERPIELLQIGDKVWALNLESQQNELADVVRLFEREAPETWILTIEGGNQIETTDEHPFYVEGRGFLRTEQLQVGDRLRTFAGETVVLAALGTRPEPRRVFNFEVAEQHNYYVGSLQVLVHNCDDDDDAEFGPDIVYRSGGDTNKTFTPRKGDDQDTRADDPARGFSTFHQPNPAEPPRKPAMHQRMRLSKVEPPLKVYVDPDDPNHILIRPGDDHDRLLKWAETRDLADSPGGMVDDLTTLLRKAKSGTPRKY